MNQALAAKNNYDCLSHWYDWLSGPCERRLMVLGLQKLAAREGEKVMEIGFGTGHALLSLAQAVGPAGKVVGIDLSAGMLAVAQARLHNAGLIDRVTLLRGDARNLPIAPDSLEAVFLCFTLELFNDSAVPDVLYQCRQALRPGGRIGVVGLSRLKPGGRMVQLYEWAQRRAPEIIDCHPIYINKALSEAGFEVVDCSLHSLWGLPVEIALGINQKTSLLC